MGATTLLLQDIPQLIIHMIFLFFMHTHIPHGDLTVIFSLCTSAFAILVSTFNVVVSHPNHFDPKLLKNELDKRKQRSFKMKSHKYRLDDADSRYNDRISDSVRRDSLFEIEDSKDSKSLVMYRFVNIGR